MAKAPFRAGTPRLAPGLCPARRRTGCRLPWRRAHPAARAPAGHDQFV